MLEVNLDLLNITRGVCVCGLAIYIKKYLKAKEEEFLMETQLHFTMQKHNLQKKTSKTTKIPSRYYYNSIITNLKFQHKPKYHLSKILI